MRRALGQALGFTVLILGAAAALAYGVDTGVIVP